MLNAANLTSRTNEYPGPLPHPGLPFNLDEIQSNRVVNNQSLFNFN